MATLAAHCIVKNEENFVGYAIKSVIDYVDKIIVFDTGSTDGTIEIIKGLARQYPDKIIFEAKGECDKKRHTELRQEMINRTSEEWFMILDGDEVWTDDGMKEALNAIESNSSIECIIAPFYLCVGDVYHYSWRGKFEILGRKIHATPRWFKLKSLPYWSGEYGRDSVYKSNGGLFFNISNSYFLKHRFWHLTHLERSSVGKDVYTSGGTREGKSRKTYFIIGKKISEKLPKVFGDNFKPLSYGSSISNFFILGVSRLLKTVIK